MEVVTFLTKIQKSEGNSTTLKNWIQKLEGKPTTLKNWIKKMEGNSTTPKNCVLTRSTIFFLVFSLIRFWIFVRNDIYRPSPFFFFVSFLCLFLLWTRTVIKLLRIFMFTAIQDPSLCKMGKIHSNSNEQGGHTSQQWMKSRAPFKVRALDIRSVSRYQH